MQFVDYFRVLLFLLFGLGCSFMVLTNFIAYIVLREPKRLGFLWWHVTSISVATFLMGVVALAYIHDLMVREEPLTLWGPLLGVGFTLFCGAQAIIFNVERKRLADKQAADRFITEPPGEQ